MARTIWKGLLFMNLSLQAASKSLYTALQFSHSNITPGYNSTTKLFTTATLHLATTALQNFLQQQKTVFMWPDYL